MCSSGEVSHLFTLQCEKLNQKCLYCPINFAFAAEFSAAGAASLLTSFIFTIFWLTNYQFGLTGLCHFSIICERNTSETQMWEQLMSDRKCWALLEPAGLQTFLIFPTTKILDTPDVSAEGGVWNVKNEIPSWLSTDDGCQMQLWWRGESDASRW